MANIPRPPAEAIARRICFDLGIDPDVVVFVGELCRINVGGQVAYQIPDREICRPAWMAYLPLAKTAMAAVFRSVERVAVIQEDVA